MDDNNIVVGTCDGTGAAINVVLGFTPSYVKVMNLEDAGGLSPQIEWFGGMQALVTALDEGIKWLGTPSMAEVTANGISAYAGGDKLTYDGATNNRWEDSAAADASEVYVDGHYKRTAAADAAYKNYAESQNPNPKDGAEITTAPGFTIGTDADLNVNGEQLVWIAFR